MVEQSGGSGGQAVGRSSDRAGGWVGRSAIRAGSLTSRRLRFNLKNAMFCIYQGLGVRCHDHNGRPAQQEPFAHRSQEKHASGLRHPSKKKRKIPKVANGRGETQCSKSRSKVGTTLTQNASFKSCKPSRREGRFWKKLANRRNKTPTFWGSRITSG